MSCFKQQVFDHLGVMHTYLRTLEASLSQEAEHVQHQAIDALQKERKTMTHYLEQLKQMETVLGEVQEEAQTEFLKVRPSGLNVYPSSLQLSGSLWNSVSQMVGQDPQGAASTFPGGRGAQTA